jgi:hypothetical protein
LSIVLGAGGLVGGFALGAALNDRSIEQKHFPCNEDEVLGFEQRFGPDKVGCIHRDTVIVSATNLD